MAAPQARYRSGMGVGFRGEGDQVPGNEPGGANGSYGAFGQDPHAQPPATPPSQQSGGWRGNLQKAGQGMQSGMQGGNAAFQTGQNLGQFGHNLQSRYRAHQNDRNAAEGSAHVGHALPPGTTSMGEDVATTPPMDSAPVQYAPITGMAQPMDSMDTPAPAAAPQMDSGVPQMRAASPMAPESGMPGMTPAPDGDGSQPVPADTPTAPNLTPPAPTQLADGSVVSKPTMALLGEKGPEAVIPLSNPGAKVTPGMFTKSRYRRPTGPSSVHGPLHPLEPLAPSKLTR